MPTYEEIEKLSIKEIEKIKLDAYHRRDAPAYYNCCNALGLSGKDIELPDLYLAGESIAEREDKKRQKEEYDNLINGEAKALYQRYINAKARGKINNSDFKVALMQSAESVIAQANLSNDLLGKVMGRISTRVHDIDKGMKNLEKKVNESQ